MIRGDVPDYALMLGVPAVRKGWMSRHGHRLVPQGADGRLVCPESGWRYQEIEPSVLRCLDFPRRSTPVAPFCKKELAVSVAAQQVSVPLLDLKAQFASIEGEICVVIDRVLTSQGFILGAGSHRPGVRNCGVLPVPIWRRRILGDRCAADCPDGDRT